MTDTNIARPAIEETKTALAVVPPPQESLTFTRDPAQVLKEAEKAAKALKRVIDSKPKHVKFNGEIYLENEDWSTVARFYGVTSRIKRTSYVEFGNEDNSVRGFEAVAEAYHVDRGEVISTAEAMCLSDEPQWSKKPLFQLRSMAQTRAGSRVLRQVFGWVIVLAGYKATPAEEMLNGGPTSGAVPQSICYECGEDIWTDAEIHNSKQKFGKTLCKVCFKIALKKEQDGANRDLTPELKKSVEFAQLKKRSTQDPILAVMRGEDVSNGGRQ